MDARLALSSDDLRLLAPAAEEWLERGVSVAEARALLTSGLPRVVHSARAFVADRLKRKIPPERPRTPAAAALAECARCRDPLPRGQRAGICGGCSGVRAVHGGAPPLEPATIAQRAGAIRDALRGVGLQV